MRYASSIRLFLLSSYAAIMSACTPALPETTPSRLSDESSTLSAQIELGRRIFQDKSLSEPEGLACASCHEAALAFTGNNQSPNPAVSLGSRPESLGLRNAPTVMYATFSPNFSFEKDEEGEWIPLGGQFWDGRAKDLIEQAKGPFLNPREMNNKDMAQVVAKLRKAPYQDLFTKAFGANVLNQDRTAFHAMATAIAAYEKSPALNPFNSKFDAVLAGRETWTEKEALGFELFKNPEKGNCLACHVGNIDSQRPEDWLFTDFTYDNLGVPRNETIAENRDPQFFDLGLCRQAHLKTPVGFDSESLCGAFKVPTLRNVAKTAPYMHNGIFKDLKTVVRFYVTRSTHPELWYPKKSDGSLALFDDIPEIYRENVNQGEAPYDRKLGEEPRLTEEEIDAVVSFMETLSDR